MRPYLLMLTAAITFVASATAQAAGATVATVATVATTLASAAADSSHPAIWEQRKLVHFVSPLTIDSENGPWQEASCDQIYQHAKFLLAEFGARPGDVHADLRGCYAYTTERSIDVTFSALAPPGKTTRNVAGPAVAAHWQTVMLSGNCAFLQYVTKTVLPLFTTRNVKLISTADCAKLGVGLYAEVLKPSDSAPAP